MSIIPYMEVGHISLSEKTKSPWWTLYEQRAYEFSLIGNYAQDIVAYDSLARRIQHKEIHLEAAVHEFLKAIHHKYHLGFTLLRLIAANELWDIQKKITYFEQGHTLYGIINALRFSQIFLKSFFEFKTQVRMSDVRWMGVEKSSLFNSLSRLLHQSYNVTTLHHTTHLTQKIDLFTAAESSMHYSFASPQQLVTTLKKARLSLFVYSFARDKAFAKNVATGMKMSFMTLESFKKACQKNKLHVQFMEMPQNRRQRSNTVRLCCLTGSQELCSRVQTRAQTLAEQLQSSCPPAIFKKLKPTLAPLFIKDLNDDLNKSAESDLVSVVTDS